MKSLAAPPRSAVRLLATVLPLVCYYVFGVYLQVPLTVGVWHAVLVGLSGASFDHPHASIELAEVHDGLDVRVHWPDGRQSTHVIHELRPVATAVGHQDRAQG